MFKIVYLCRNRGPSVGFHFLGNHRLPTAHESSLPQKGMKDSRISVLRVPLGRSAPMQTLVESNSHSVEIFRKNSILVFPKPREEAQIGSVETKRIHNYPERSILNQYRPKLDSSMLKHKLCTIHAKKKIMKKRLLQTTGLHPCLLQKLGGICQYSHSGIQKCPYRNVPAEICLEYLETGSCSNRQSCPWVHEDTASYHARQTESEKKTAAQQHEFDEEQQSCRETQEVSKVERYTTEAEINARFTVSQWAHICHDSIIIAATLCGLPGMCTDFSTLQRMLRDTGEINCSFSYIFYLLSLHRTLFEIRDGTVIQWKGCNTTRNEQHEKVLISPQFSYKTIPESWKQKTVNIQSPFKESSCRENMTNFSVEGSREVSMKNRVPLSSKKICSDGSTFRAPHTVNCNTRKRKVNVRILAMYELYWKVIDRCLCWNSAHRHLKQIVFLDSKWDPNLEHGDLKSFKNSKMPTSLIQKMILLFSLTVNKASAGKEFLAYFDQATNKGCGGIFSHYKLREKDITMLVKSYPFLVPLSVGPYVVNCAKFLPESTDWFGECVLAAHNGIYRGSTEKKSEGSSTKMKPVSYFIVHEDNLCTQYDFYTDLLLRFIDKGVCRRPSRSYHQEKTPCDNFYGLLDEPCRMPLEIMKLYLLSCLQTKSPSFTLKKMKAVLSFSRKFNRVPMELDDSGHALIMKILNCSGRKKQLWNYYRTIMRQCRSRKCCLPWGSEMCSKKSAKNIAYIIRDDELNKGGLFAPRDSTMQTYAIRGYNPVCSEYMAKYVCGTVQELEKMLECVVQATSRGPPVTLPAKCSLSSTSPASNFGTAWESTNGKTILISKSALPPSRFRILKTAILKACSLNEYEHALKFLRKYGDWACEEYDLVDQTFRVAQDESATTYRFPNLSEEIRTLAKDVLWQTRRMQHVSAEYSILRKLYSVGPGGTEGPEQ